MSKRTLGDIYQDIRVASKDARAQGFFMIPERYAREAIHLKYPEYVAALPELQWLDILIRGEAEAADKCTDIRVWGVHKKNEMGWREVRTDLVSRILPMYPFKEINVRGTDNKKLVFGINREFTYV